MKETVTAKKAAELLGCSPRMVYRLFEQGELLGYRIGSKILLYADSVPEYIEGHKNQPPVKPASSPAIALAPRPRTKGPSVVFKHLHL